MMKKLSIVLFIVFSIQTAVKAQISKPQEVKAKMSKGLQTGWKILIPEVDDKTAKKAWEKLMKDFDAKTSSVKKSDDYLSEQANISALSTEKLDVYVQFEEVKNGTYVTAFFSQTDGFLSSAKHSSKKQAIQTLMINYGKEVAKAHFEDKLDKAEGDLKSLNKEQDKLVKDKEGYEKDIEDCQKSIEDNKKNIEQNTKDQEEKKKEIAEQSDAVKNLGVELEKYK